MQSGLSTRASEAASAIGREERTAYGEWVGLVLFFFSAIVAVAGFGSVGKSARQRGAGSKMQLGFENLCQNASFRFGEETGGQQRGGPQVSARWGPISVRQTISLPPGEANCL